MKTIAKFTSFDHEFTVKVIKRETDTNYNQFCHVFHEKEERSLLGTSFKDNETKENIIEWAKKAVRELQSEELAKDICIHRKPLTAEEQYPEYAKEAKEIAMNACRAINNASIALYRERGIKCPYPAQCLLEMVVKDLEARI